MSSLSQLRADLQTRFQDKAGGFLSATPANRYINIALEDFHNDVQPVTREYGFYVTANQFRYALPADYIHSRAMMWYQNGPSEVTYKSPQEFKALGYLDKKVTSSKPDVYTIIDGDLYLGPIPSTSSNTTTLGAAISSTTATSITQTDGTKFNQNGGIFLVESEQIAYQLCNQTTGVMTLCKRGQGGTTAATHTNSTATYRLDLVMTYAYAHTDIADGSSPAFSARYHRLPIHYALHMALKSDGRDGPAQEELNLYLQKKVDAKREIRRQTRDIANRRVRPVYD